MGNLTVLVASDSFKGSASSREVNELIERGALRVDPSATVLTFPIAGGFLPGGTLRVTRRGPLPAIMLLERLIDYGTMGN
ncbi:glycerate kinase [uncultured Parolsenella sp.]|uniref:glycerate kinase n=1 Tax=uncultured Parolsenella sp. TaxID=2083008 RepID=UPI0027D974B3|nr:glycerate kinase [uncultured Parolsenella sp.]